MAGRVPSAAGGPPPEGTRFTGDEISAINRFPDDNPNPVLRFDDAGRLIYANPASDPVLEALGTRVGRPIPAAMLARFAAAAPGREFVEVVHEGRTYALWPVPIHDLGFTNLYGRDVTAERAITKFPDENPNPVLRIGRDGVLLYANAASETLVHSLGMAVGAPVAPGLRDELLADAGTDSRSPVRVRAGDRTYTLLPVEVAGFGFVNVYGTDVTDTVERERLARENERLLLNILPEPIARRLRDGEPLIADRFDDVTLLFADIVEFTRLSSGMSPAELVGVLNDVFCAFDGLVEQHGLEKVKTIGDAYMVVGGMPHRSDDHTERVAAMALELTEAVGRIEAATRLGVNFRIGMHCGPVVAGVIGTKKFIYDVWGDTVNLASRMESMGMPGRVQVTHAVHERLRDLYEFEPRGMLDVKGKGPTPAWLLVPRSARRAAGAAQPDRGAARPVAGA